VRARITLRTVARTLGVTASTVCKWENRQAVPRHGVGVRYCRFLAGLARHQAVTWDDDCEDIVIGI
jgi:hypothetical protein